VSKQSVSWIVTINYRTADLVVESLRALKPQIEALGGGQVLVVDNASGDGSVEKIAAAIDTNNWSDWASVRAMDKNGGFAFGNNIGFTQAFASNQHVDYVMLLNPDSAAREGAIKSLVDFMDKNPEIGVVGSRLQNQDGGLEPSAHNFHSPLSELVEGARLGILTRLLSRCEVTPVVVDVPHRCDWVSGSSMMIRRRLIEDIGLMDEGFFLYFEEVDFFKRAANAGWQTWYVPGSVVMHIEGASTGIKSTQRRPAYWYNSRRRFFVKHYGILGLVAADSLWTIGRLSFFVRRFLKLGAQGEMSDPKYYSLDVLWGDAKSIFTGNAWKIKPLKNSTNQLNR
jgi:N-acetylglucosaminyl-diphospho-decaprenol L-rhamnosyltransferase